MLKTYLPWDIAHLVFEFTDGNWNSVQADSDVLVSVGENGKSTVLLKDGVCTLVINDTNTNYLPHVQKYTYVYDLLIPKETPLGSYITTVTATVWTENRTQITDLEIWGAYVTVTELKASKIWFDFSTYSDEQLQYAILLAKELIEAYCDRERWKSVVTQKGETVVDNLWRIYFRFRSKPVIKVNSIRVRVPASTGIDLIPTYLDLFENQGYGYYPISTAYWASAVGTYPLIVLGFMDKLLYYIEYEADPNIPFLIKHASMLICTNVLKADYYYNSLWIADVIGPVTDFKSGSYSVQFDTGDTYHGKGYQWGQFLSPDVQELLDRFKVMKSNSMF